MHFLNIVLYLSALVVAVPTGTPPLDTLSDSTKIDTTKLHERAIQSTLESVELIERGLFKKKKPQPVQVSMSTESTRSFPKNEVNVPALYRLLDGAFPAAAGLSYSVSQSGSDIVITTSRPMTQQQIDQFHQTGAGQILDIQ